jgi:hypothetical protein
MEEAPGSGANLAGNVFIAHGAAGQTFTQPSQAAPLPRVSSHPGKPGSKSSGKVKRTGESYGFAVTYYI